MKIRSLIGPLAFTLPAVLVLLTMGFWQLERLSWKEGLIAERAVALRAEPVLLPQDDKNMADMNFRRVYVTGRFLHEKTQHLQNRNLNGVRGIDLITPLQRTAEEGAGIVLVNRGWLPLKMLPQFDALKTRNAETTPVRIQGVVRSGARDRNAFTPDNIPEESLWFSVDPRAIAQILNLKIPSLVIQADQASKPGEYPVSGLSTYNLKNNHLSYALTWFALAAALMLIFGLFVRRLRDQG
ncbi:MAG: SURF1 family protein [Alphaproteobacteria bacterium]|mgnify:FL=1|jgi:surfeit locus 1 family protein|nr:SURF1 family protein [Alphaproteobacteria bacterium]MBT4019702.1 SURF1 family protein [Alphaproteobacteria bacterium]MBT5159113.1 SURF1 family protein [Alphaproteobacteria bacterium]MBT5920306.1 SURF1 family protein [Alphaproteobacteria bacterium]